MIICISDAFVAHYLFFFLSPAFHFLSISIEFEVLQMQYPTASRLKGAAMVRAPSATPPTHSRKHFFKGDHFKQRLFKSLAARRKATAAIVAVVANKSRKYALNDMRLPQMKTVLHTRI